MKQSRPRDCGPPRRPSPSPSPWKSMRGAGHGCATNHGSHDAIGDRVNVTRVFCTESSVLKTLWLPLDPGGPRCFYFQSLSDSPTSYWQQLVNGPPPSRILRRAVVRDALCPARRSCWTLRAGALDDPGSCQGGNSAPCRQFPLAQPATHRAATGNLWPNGPWGLAH